MRISDWSSDVCSSDLNLGNISNPALYGVARVGTKRLISDYIYEVSRCLDFICIGEFADFGFDEKIQFFKRTATSFGRSALMLSGGGTLGRSEGHTSELQSLMRISYAVFCLTNKNRTT